MIKRLKDNFERGAKRIRWFAEIFSERFKVEVALVRLLYQSDDLDKKKNELLQTIGERVYEMKKQGEKNIQKDAEILRVVEEIDRLNRDAGDLRKKVSDITSVSI